MGKIKQLDEALSNMIAAGEVVENMASVVKELVENAIDANSDVVEIHLVESGLKDITVLDNGDGFLYEDLFLAFKRHATSKIKTQHDLYHIASLGFRGEALPSIASVSELEIESSISKDAGTKLVLKSGEVIEESIGSARKGTRIKIKNLFYNTPARLKHLKSEQKELSFIVDYINKIALAHPHIKFTLTNNKKVLLKTMGDNDSLKILHQIYGLDIVKEMVPFEAKNQYFSLSGYLCKPVFTRSSRQHMTLITNHRMIRNQRLLSAISEGYKTYLPIGKYPIILLAIEVDPLLIDVNIHPQKLEVKFTEQASLEQLIKQTIDEALKGQSLVPEIKEDRPKKMSEQPSLVFSEDNTADSSAEDSEAATQTLKEEGFIFFEEHSNEPCPFDSEEIKTPKKEQNSPSQSRIPAMDYIGQYLGTYLLFQSEDGLTLVDQHAAAERVRYERYYEAMQKEKYKAQPLLVPMKLRLSNQEMMNYEHLHLQLKTFGLITKAVDATSLEILEIPSWFHKDYEETYAEHMIRILLKEDELSSGAIIDQLAKDLSCKHSIRANKYINTHEVNQLMKDLRNANNPFTCPHGRPTMIRFTQHEIERMFKRIQS